MTETLDKTRIDAIVQRVLREAAQGGQPSAGHPTPAAAPHLSHVGRAGRSAVAPAAAGRDGIFTTIDDAVRAARAAFVALGGMTLEKRYEIVAAIRAAMLTEADSLARMAHEETGLGRPEDKYQKNLLTARKTPGPEALQPLAWTGDHGLSLVERAPYGVIGAITPVTNPTSTIINNSISMLSAGNAVVFNVHPGAKRTCSYQIQLINRAVVGAGGPANLLTAIAEPTIASAQELMRHPGIRLLMVRSEE
ncbi:MAG: aldehyde dehydrogenase family protein, partial [Anaerolineae bacterium]|nr:aldehyde dehydrogenase family protein [Anaerolineae bacterium]